MAFMAPRGDHSDWEFKLISRPTLHEVLAELQSIAYRGICHDPNPDGSGGMLLSLEQVRLQCP